MGLGTVTRWHRISDGRAGALETLALVADRIRQPSPFVRQFLAAFLRDSEDQSDEWRAARLFRLVQRIMHYTPDPPGLADEIRTADFLLHQFVNEGRAIGDCDDYVILLGALYRGIGWPVRLVAVSVSPDRVLEHVYLQVLVPGLAGWRSADGIVPEPFGWEIPPAEITDRVMWPV